jgi:hypothetical protein
MSGFGRRSQLEDVGSMEGLDRMGRYASTCGGDDDRGSGTISRAMEDSFDVVAIGVEDECAVVARVIAAFARSAIVATSCCNCGRVECINRLAIWRLECQVNSGNLPISLVDPQFVSREVTLPFGIDVRLAKGGKHSAVETLAHIEVRDAQVDVIDEPADVELHGLLLAVWRLT